MRIVIMSKFINADYWSRVGGSIFEHPLFYALVWLWLAVCALQDWRYREVSNWLTLPVLVVGLGVAVAAGGERLVCFLLSGLVYGIGAARDQVGGADFKVATALGALWPEALLFGHIAVFFWGLVAKIMNKKVPFVVPLTIGAAVPLLTAVALPSIIISKDVIIPAVLQPGWSHVVCFLTTHC
jgi:prepilin signal peptidase PulO-like enzyme (type II secretory pathway)